MPGNILVIEDEPAIADTLTYALSTDGFAPDWFPTGREGLAAATAKRYDLAVLDIGLPDINGFELFRELQRRCTIPVIFLTARSEEVDRIVGLELGADDYISKPFSPREVCARVRTVLRRLKKEQDGLVDTVLQDVSLFVVDEDRKLISYRGTPIELSKTEYRLLRTIVERPGRVYSREELMKKAWDHPETSLDRTVDAHVKQIRAKLRAISPEDDPIQTHRGIGYSLKESG